MRKVFLLSLLLVVLSLVIPWLVVTLGPAPEPADPCIISRIAAFCGESLFLLAIIKTSKLSNFILHQFEGLHKLWDTPYWRNHNFIFYKIIGYLCY